MRFRLVLVAAALGACGTTDAPPAAVVPSEAGAPADAGLPIHDASTADVALADAATDASAPEPCPGCGFWDPELAIGTWRTDFDDPATGTSTRPLTLLDCPFTLGSDPEVLNGAGATYWDENANQQVACDKTSSIYPASNAATSAATWPLQNFWVISVNNERSYGLEGSCSDSGPNTGPPNQSKKPTAPGQGTFGVAVAAGKATLAIDTNAFPNCVSPVDKGKIPFLSIGAQTGRGQDKPITFLNDPDAPAVLKFKATIEDFAPAGIASSLDKPRANFGFVFVEAQWGGMRRFVFINIFNRHFDPPAFVRRHWNWNMQESLWYPGAEIVYLDGDRAAGTCGSAKTVSASLPSTPGASFEYALDLNALFKCFSGTAYPSWTTVLPTTKLAVTGVHWAIEQTYGKNWTRLAIERPRLAKE